MMMPRRARGPATIFTISDQVPAYMVVLYSSAALRGLLSVFKGPRTCARSRRKCAHATSRPCAQAAAASHSFDLDDVKNNFVWLAKGTKF